MDGNTGVARRVRAARALAGLDSVQALAEKISQGGLSTKTLRAIEQSKRHAEPRELATIAEACDLPAEFFKMDFWAAADAPGPDVVSRLQAAVAELRSTVDQHQADIELLAGEVRRQSEAADPARTGRPPQSPPPSAQP